MTAKLRTIFGVAIFALLAVVAMPAFAQSAYDTGYNSGYYGTGNQPQSQTSDYGRGYEDGAYDSDGDDAAARQRSIDFENQLTQEQQRDSNPSLVEQQQP